MLERLFAKNSMVSVRRAPTHGVPVRSGDQTTVLRPSELSESFVVHPKLIPWSVKNARAWPGEMASGSMKIHLAPTLLK